jgi:hypothetical protein
VREYKFGTWYPIDRNESPFVVALAKIAKEHYEGEK